MPGEDTSLSSGNSFPGSKMQFRVKTDSKTDIIDVTGRIEEELPDDFTGLATVFVPHTTAGVTVNENEEGLLEDIEDLLLELVHGDDYLHDRIDDNASAHLRQLLVGTSETIPVKNGELELGTWQRLLFMELDGPRERKIKLVTMEKES